MRALSTWIERVWYGQIIPPRPVEASLRAVSCLWCAGTLVSTRATRPCRGALPTIGISSPTVGGSGKTPLARWIAERLHERGITPAVVTRGHGGCLAGPLRVQPDRHHASDVGDEPLWLASCLPDVPVIVSRNRLEGIRTAADLGARVAVLDDSIMLRDVVLDRELMVMGSTGLIGNGRCLPAGPLRVPPQIIQRGHALVIIVEPGSPPGWEEMATNLAGSLPVRRATMVTHGILTPDGVRRAPSWLVGIPVVAWAGIARPWRFRNLLLNLGVDIRLFVSLPDHHRYSRRDVERLAREVDVRDAVPLTTTKDRARWPSWARWIPYSLDVGLDLHDPEDLLTGLV